MATESRARSKKLTAVAAAQARPRAAVYELPDAGCPGLRLVVQPSGAKSWVMRYRSPVERERSGKGRQRKLTLGPLGEVASAGQPEIGHPLILADARTLAGEVALKIRQGADPAADLQIAKRAERDTAGSSRIEDVLASFMARHTVKRNKRPIRESTRRETGRLFGLVPANADLTAWQPREPRSGIVKAWWGRDVRKIAKADVRDVLDDIVAAGSPVAANRMLSALATFFTWCEGRDIIPASPCKHVEKPSPESPVERELSGDEIVALWRACDRTAFPYGDMVKLVLLTGQRRDEIREAPPGEFHLGNRTWIIPPPRTKNGREHLVPLSDAAVAVVAGLPKITVRRKRPWLFTVSGEVPISGLAKRKRNLDALMLDELRKIDPETTNLKPWRIHDLRHTLKTWMQRERIPQDVRNAVQNHHTGDMDTLYGHYSFEREKREALDRWASHVAAIVKGANVVTLGSTA